MIGEYNESNGPMGLTKTKRDEYLIEIRKKKNLDMIRQKRMKYFTNDDLSNNPDMLVEDTTQAHMSQKALQDVARIQSLPEEVKQRLLEVKEAFYQAAQNCDWENLIQIIKFLRESIGNDENKVPARAIIELDIVPVLLNLLGEDFEKLRNLQSECAWLLANISAGSSEDTAYLFDQGILPVLYGSLSTTNEDLHENVMWALANIAGEKNLKYRDEILKQGILKKIVRQLCTTPKRILYSRTAVWLISNLLRGKPYPPYEEVSGILVPLASLIKDNPDDLTLEYILLSLSYISENEDNAKLNTIGTYGFIPLIVKFITHSNENICLYALKCAGNLARGNLKITRQLSENEIFNALPYALKHEKKNLRMEACLALANILADEFDDHDYVLDNDIIPILIERMRFDDWDIRTQATICISNFAHNCTLDDSQALVQKDIFSPILANLTINDTGLILASLRALYEILAHGETLKKSHNGINPYINKIFETGQVGVIETLQEHPENEVYDEVSRLINKYFQTDQTNDNNIYNNNYEVTFN